MNGSSSTLLMSGANGITLNANQGSVDVSGNMIVSGSIYGTSNYNGNSSALTVAGGNTTTASNDAAILVLEDLGNVGTIAFLTNASSLNYSPIVTTGDNLIFSNFSKNPNTNLDIFVSSNNPNGVKISENSTTIYGGTGTSMNSIVVSQNGIIMTLGVGEVSVLNSGIVTDYVSTSSLSISNGGSIYGTYGSNATTVSISGGNTNTTGSSDVPILTLNDLAGVGTIQFLTNANASDYCPIVNTGDNILFSRSNVASNLDIVLQSSSPNGVQISENSTTIYGGGAGTNPTNCNSIDVGPTNIQINANQGNVNVNGNLNIGNYDPSNVSYYLSSSYTISNNWKSIAISETGQYQTAVNGSTVIYTSSTYGASWTATTVGYTCYSVSMSNSGQYQLISCSPNSYTANSILTSLNVYYSLNGNTPDISWNLTTWFSGNVINPVSCSVSPDGSLFVVTGYSVTNTRYVQTYFIQPNSITSSTTAWQNTGNILYDFLDINSMINFSTSTSNDGSIINTSFNYSPGTYYFFNETLQNSNLYTIIQISNLNNVEITYNAMSDNGQYWLVCSNSSGVYVSSNYGSSFTQLPNLTTISPNVLFVWSSCSVSLTGQYQSVVSNYKSGTSYIYVSNNFGSTFQLLNTSTTNNWSSVSIGDNYVSVCGNNLIETYTNYGVITSNAVTAFAISANTLNLNNMMVSGMQCGTATTINNGSVVFLTAFASPPIVVATAVFSGASNVYNVFASVSNITNTGFNYIITSITTSSPQTVTTSYPVNWIAML